MHFDRLDETYAMIQSNWHFDIVTQTGLTGLHDRFDWFAQIVRQTSVFANYWCQQLPKKYLWRSQKRKKWKQDDRLNESQRGALHKFFQPSSNADLNEDQGQEPDQMQENDHNLNTKI